MSDNTSLRMIRSVNALYADSTQDEEEDAGPTACYDMGEGAGIALLSVGSVLGVAAIILIVWTALRTSSPRSSRAAYWVAAAAGVAAAGCGVLIPTGVSGYRASVSSPSSP